MDDFDKDGEFDCIQLLKNGKLEEAYIYVKGKVSIVSSDIKPLSNFFYLDDSIVKLVTEEKNKVKK
jgi:hypothetical protein